MSHPTLPTDSIDTILNHEVQLVSQISGMVLPDVFDALYRRLPYCYDCRVIHQKEMFTKHTSPNRESTQESENLADDLSN